MLYLETRTWARNAYTAMIAKRPAPSQRKYARRRPHHPGVL
jgi:hypothetical protein